MSRSVASLSAEGARNAGDRLRRFDPALAIWIGLALILAVLVLNPLGRLFVSSFQDPVTGALTLQNYVTAFGRSRNITALWNTVVMGAAVVVVCAALALPLAWACARTDMPARNLVRLSVLGAFIMPPYLSAVAWILLAGPNQGWINRIWESATGASTGIVNVFTFWGLVFVIAFNLFFFLFIFATSALELISSEMEDAANILGAGTWRTARAVTFPLILPAVIGGMIVIFLQSIALYGVPAMLALPARYPVLVTQLWQFFEVPVRVEVAAAYSVPLLLFTCAMIGLQRLLLARRGYGTVTGKGGERRLIRLGPWRWPMFFCAMAVCTVTLFLPLLILLQAAFSKAWGRGFTLDNMTLGNFHYVLFEHATAKQAVLNSFVFASVAATVATLLTLAIAYIVQRRLIAYGGVLTFLCMAPFVIPGVVLAIGFYAAYAPPPLALYGTATILILAFITRFLPIAYSSNAASIRSLNVELEDAVRITGGGRVRVVRSVVAPLLKRAMIGSWILIFVPAAQELSTAVFLVGPRTRVMSVLMLDLSEQGYLEQLAALGCILLVVILAIVALGFTLLGRDFMLRRVA
jgi:iron(III) transport system permease protein